MHIGLSPSTYFEAEFKCTRIEDTTIDIHVSFIFRRDELVGIVYIPVGIVRRNVAEKVYVAQRLFGLLSFVDAAPCEVT